MRSAVAAFVVATVGGLLLLAFSAARDEGDIAFTNSSAVLGEVASLPRGGSTCVTVADSEAFEGVRLWTVAKRNDQTFSVRAVERRTGRELGRGTGTAEAGPGIVHVETGEANPSGPVDICLNNTGEQRMGFAGAPGPERIKRDGVSRAGDPTIVFTRESRSLLERLPDAFERAALFKPGFMGAWTFWLLAAGVIMGFPLLLGIALGRAVREETETDRGSGENRRRQRFYSEVEPALGAAPRVHRFAAPPLKGAPSASGAPIALCIEQVDGADIERTRASVERQTVAPVAVFEAGSDEVQEPTSAPWLAIVRAGDELRPIAVERLGQAALLAPDALLLTSDEDHRHPHSPALRPGPSPDLLLWQDLTSSLLCLRTDAIGKLPLVASDWRHRAALALGGPNGAGLAHVPLILNAAAGPGHFTDPTDAVCQALRAWGEPEVRVENGGHGHRVVRPVGGEPSIEVIVLFRDAPDLLDRCVSSVLDNTAYENLRLTLVDNGSVEPATVELVRKLTRHANLHVLDRDEPFNFARLNNAAAKASEADFVVFLNNDTEVVSSGWVEALLGEAQRREVGAVAPLLVYESGLVQHAGAAVGLHDYGGHPFAGLAPDADTPFGTATDGTRNWLAVTAACMMVERRKFEEVNGFDERFVVAGNDVDLCLRLTAAGYRSLCVTQTRLVHHEGSSRGEHVDPGDYAESERSYGAFRTVGDPFYNPNLTLKSTDCGLRGPDEL